MERWAIGDLGRTYRVVKSMGAPPLVLLPLERAIQHMRVGTFALVAGEMRDFRERLLEWNETI